VRDRIHLSAVTADHASIPRDALSFCYQLTAKACAALLTQCHCRNELLLRCGVKLDLHLLSWE